MSSYYIHLLSIYYISIVIIVVRSYLACYHRVPERYRTGFVQHVYVGLHVVAVDGFGRTWVQVGRWAADHLLASVAHSRGTPATGHTAKRAKKHIKYDADWTWRCSVVHATAYKTWITIATKLLLYWNGKFYVMATFLCPYWLIDPFKEDGIELLT